MIFIKMPWQNHKAHDQPLGSPMKHGKTRECAPVLRHSPETWCLTRVTPTEPASSRRSMAKYGATASKLNW